MRDLYFLTGMIIGAGVGAVVVYKSKKAKQVMQECEKSIAEITTEKNEDKTKTKEKKAK